MKNSHAWFKSITIWLLCVLCSGRLSVALTSLCPLGLYRCIWHIRSSSLRLGTSRLTTNVKHIRKLWLWDFYLLFYCELVTPCTLHKGCTVEQKIYIILVKNAQCEPSLKRNICSEGNYILIFIKFIILKCYLSECYIIILYTIIISSHIHLLLIYL